MLREVKRACSRSHLAQVAEPRFYASSTNSRAALFKTGVECLPRLFSQDHYTLIKNKDFSVPDIVLNSNSANFLLGSLGLIT